MHPTLISIGGFHIATYGVMNMLGYLAAIYYLIYHRKKINIEKDTLWNILFIAIVGAIVGGKLFYIIVEASGSFAERMTELVTNFRYGFTYFGGFLVVVPSLIFYIKKKGLPLIKTGDFIVVALPLGHAIGRIGCFMAGCCFGRPAGVPWAVTFNNPDALVPEHLHGVHLHPTQLYEVVANLIIFGLLHFVYKKNPKDGTILALYAACYGALRFTIEFFRGDFRGEFFLGMSPAQLVSVGIMTAAAIFYFYMRKRDAKKGNI